MQLTVLFPKRFSSVFFLDIKDGDKDGPAAHLGRDCRQRQGGDAESAGGGAQVNKNNQTRSE